MPWGTELPTRVRSHRAAWFGELTALPAPPHQEVWTGTTQANVATASATAVMDAPTAVSSVVAYLPASGDSFPHELPWQFGAAKGSMAARAEMPTPAVGVGPNVVEVPTMTASAAADAPTAASGATVYMPDGAGGNFPHQFPHQFHAPTASMVAAVSTDSPVLSVDAVVAAVVMTASAGMSVPNVLSGAVVAAAIMEAAAEMLAPTVTADTVVPAPVMTAGADAAVPSVASGAAVGSPVMEAVAEGLTPDVDVTVIDFTVEAPVMEASAVMEAADMAAVVEVPVMQASAETNGFPYRFPRSFMPNGMHAPAAASGASTEAQLAAAAADASAPGVVSGAVVAAPSAAASAAAAAPSATSSAAAAIPVEAASAAMQAPAVSFTLPPIVTTYSTVGSYSYDVTALRAAGYTHIDRIVLGSGQGGAGGTFLSANGGNAGVFNSDTIVLADYPSATAIAGTVPDGGNGGGSGSDGSAGSAATATIGANTLTGAGGPTGSSGGRNGDAVSSGNTNSNKDLLLNGQTYVGGPTSTTTTASVPGSGGYGGGTFGSGSKGGRGQVWFCARRDN